MAADKLMGPKVKISLAKYLPEVFLDAIKKSSEAGVMMFDNNHENPELIWNEEARNRLTKIAKMLSEK